MKIETSISFEELKRLFQERHEEAISAFYKAQRDGFFRWAKMKFSLDEDTIADVYQDAIVALYNATIENRVDHVQSSPEAYLFGIARNMMLKKSSSSKRTQYVDEFADANIGEINEDIHLKYEREDIQKRIKTAMSLLKKGCQEIIELYYFRRYTNESIAAKLGYDNTDVVKTRKYQCMKELKKLFK